MDSLFKAKKLQAINSHKAEFLHNTIFYYLVVAVTCSLICFYPYWFPSPSSSSSSSLKNFLFLSLSSTTLCSSIFSPKCLFVVVNVIVVFLVGESMLVGSHSSPASEIYDEYVERSRSTFPSSMVDERKLEMNLAHGEKRVNVVQKEQVKEEIKQVNESFSRGSSSEEDKEEEESGLAADELNKRVEEFIARVNKQRWLEEARLLAS